MHRRWRPTAAAAVASGLMVGLMATNVGAAGGTAAPSVAPAPPREVHRVTLVTGDLVSMFPGPKGTWQTSVQSGEGRGKVNFREFSTKEKHYVIPADVAELVAEGVLDRRLFDVAGLAADGYDDKEAASIPLIVTFRGKAGRSAVKSSGADQTRQLASVNGAAVRVAKNETANFVESVVTGPRTEPRLAAGVEKVWLDGKRKPLLEESVPQIGAPTAWEAGYTGKGVKVAVLDTGVEGTHPDLAGQVAESKNFTDVLDGDALGHGTHVAGTVAGTGSASDGRRKGVAPDATLLDGKVCGDDGCPESAILAGMQWAATEKDADVINLSLGGTDTPEIDPLEEAVNTLTEQTGALFVISAGNEGDWDEPVGSPGSADAALTVGAVDKSDELASFSSRGPRVGDDAIKPDVTAPGVDIIAPKSENAKIGEPVDEQYLRLSGTSMAAPHVAGTAALLAQQHPDWEAAELKAALMASAKSHPDQGIFEQGAGRVDAAAAVEQSVFTTTPSLSLGRAVWPHDDDAPIVKRLTYRNTGTEAVTFDLAAEMTRPDGDAAPDDALTLSASEVTVPAGGEASVQVTGNTNHDGPDGLYSGRVTATNTAGSTVTTPVAVHKEAESYDLTARYLGPDGAPIAGYSTLVNAGGSDFEEFYPDNGTFTKRLPKGSYLLRTELSADWDSFYVFVQPNLVLDKDTTIDIDARTAKPVTHSVPASGAVRETLATTVSLTTATGGARITAFYNDDPVFTRSVGEGRPEDEFYSTVGSEWTVPEAEGESREFYSLFDYRRGSYFTGHTMAPGKKDFATVVSKLRAPGVPAQGGQIYFPRVPGVGSGGAGYSTTPLPRTETHHLHGPDDIQWDGGLVVDSLNDDDPHPAAFYDGQATAYRPGKVYRDVWNGAVVGPDPAGTFAERTGGGIEFKLQPYTDSERHVSGAELFDSASAKLYRNGDLLGEADWVALEVEDVPADRGDFRLEVSVDRDPAATGPLSTRIDSAWTFSSKGTDGPESLPLWSVHYQPKVDDFNAMKRRTVTRLPIRVESDLGKDAAKLRKVAVEVSGDDGTTWRKATLKRTGNGRYLATFTTPTGESVSLRATVADTEGNTAKQTIIAAYLLR